MNIYTYLKLILLLVSLFLSYKGNLNYYYDEAAILLPIIFGLPARLIIQKFSKSSKLKERLSFSYIVAGLLWTVFWLIVVDTSEPINQALVFLPLLYGTIYSLLDELLTKKVLVFMPLRKLIGLSILFLGIYSSFSLSIIPGSSILNFVDLGSILILVIIVGPMLILSGHFQDMILGIIYLFSNGQVEATTKELRVSLIGLNLAIKGTYLAIIIGLIPWIINIPYHYKSGVDLYILIATAILTPLYGLFINALFYSAKARISKELVYREA